MKRLLSITLAIAYMLLLAPIAAYAIDFELSSLTVIIGHGEKMLEWIDIAVCRVASAREVDGGIVYDVMPAFSGAGADFTDFYHEKSIALSASLDAYASANNIMRSQQVTDNNGRAAFSGLPAGLYLVAQISSKSSYIIAPYLVSVPNLNETADGWNYNVITYPKAEPVKNENETVSVSVYKIWVRTDNPPSSIYVQLYRNGSPYENTISLHAGNHWSYTWYDLNPLDIWTVDEFAVPAGYTKTVSGNAGSGFVITNTKNTDILDEAKSNNHRPAAPKIENTVNLEPDSAIVAIKPADAGNTETLFGEQLSGEQLSDAQQVTDIYGIGPLSGLGHIGIPKTADTSNILMWIMLTIVGAAGMFAAINSGRKAIVGNGSKRGR